tara:strand:+ start:4760 stop:4939 length:180 start_codon:yes stop_codon:yes gene_type:complete
MVSTDKSKELKTEVDRVSSSVSRLRDDLLTFQNDFNNFKDGVVKDLKNIVEYLGKQKNK